MNPSVSATGKAKLTEPGRPLRTAAACALLALLVVAIYYPCASFGFTNFDDDVYIRDNPNVTSGLTASGLRWALTTGYQSNWFPVTWISFMADAQIALWMNDGEPDRHDAGIYHITNVLIHVANTLLLFALLLRLTRSRWRSALAAALFAAHPLRVESVVWVVERKDVLSAFFYLASLWFYAAYARRPNTRSYLAVVAAFVLGIMSKQMVVSLPFVLLALDFWPLGRFAGKGALRKLLIEKIPLFVLALAGALAAHLAMNVFPKMAGAAYLPKTHPLGVAAASVIHSYAFYLWKTVVPTDLAAFYPHPGASLAVWVVPASIVGLVLITLAAWKAARARPYLAMGWAWYAVTLLPTAGIVYSGQLAAADRFTYIPSIGLCIALAWLIPEARSTVAKTVSTALACAAIVALGAASWVQVGYWSDSIALFERALRVTTNNSTAHYNLGAALIDQREFDQGIFHYERALEIDPRDSRVLNRMGIMLSMAGRHDEAIDHINRALEVVPTSEGTQSNLGVALMNAGRTDEAAKIFTNILKRNPNNALARENLETVRQHQLNQQ